MVSCFGSHSRNWIIDSRGGGTPRFLAVTQVCRSSTTIRRIGGKRVEGERRREDEDVEEDFGTGRRRGTLVGLASGARGRSEFFEFSSTFGSELEAVVASLTVVPSLLLGGSSARQLSREGAARC